MKIYVWNTREYFTCQFHRKSVYYNITCISLSAIQVSKGLILIVDILANTLYYSFKIFPQFWLAKSTHIIHHNQLLMTKFGRILCLTRKWRQKCSLLQVNAPLTEKTWGWDWEDWFKGTSYPVSKLLAVHHLRNNEVIFFLREKVTIKV